MNNFNELTELWHSQKSDVTEEFKLTNEMPEMIKKIKAFEDNESKEKEIELRVDGNNIENKKIINEKSNRFPHIFKDDFSFIFFERLFYHFQNSKNQLAEFSFIYREMKDDGLIVDSFGNNDFLRWFCEEYDIDLGTKLKTRSQIGDIDQKSFIYNQIKGIVKEES